MSQEIREQIDKVRNWKKPLNEDFFSPQRNFNEAIYLTYVESHSNNFRHVSKENFYKYLADKKSKSEEKSFDKNNKYRLADSKEIWYNNRGIKIGEIWRQAKETNEYIKYGVNYHEA